jgi:hypothetical protein
VTINQADRLEAHEALASTVGRKAAGTVMNTFDELDNGIVGLNHKVDLLTVRFDSMDKSLATTNNWLRVQFATFAAFNTAILVLLLQMR